MVDKELQSDWVAESLEGLKPLVTVPQAKQVLLCSQRNIYRLIKSGRLRAKRPVENGSRLYILRESLEQYLRNLEDAA